MSKTLTAYIIGFALSIVLTLAAFFVVIRPGFFQMGSGAVIATILALAVAQLTVQMLFFLHLGSESGPRWNLVVFLSTVSIVLIIVMGSLWIMNHLNYNMTPGEMNTYMLKQEGMRR